MGVKFKINNRRVQLITKVLSKRGWIVRSSKAWIWRRKAVTMMVKRKRW